MFNSFLFTNQSPSEYRAFIQCCGFNWIRCDSCLLRRWLLEHVVLHKLSKTLLLRFLIIIIQELQRVRIIEWFGSSCLLGHVWQQIVRIKCTCADAVQVVCIVAIENARTRLKVAAAEGGTTNTINGFVIVS